MYLTTYLVIAFVNFLIVGVAEHMERRRIPNRTYALAVPPPQRRREMTNAFITTPIHAVLLAAFVESGLLRPTESLLTVLTTFVITFLWTEIWHYVSHRLMHWRPLHFIHCEHHKSRITGMWTSVSFSLLEKAIFSAGIIGFMAALSHAMPVSVLGLAAYYVFYFVTNTLGHANIEIRGPDYYASFMGRIFNTPSYHAMHHARYTNNYGLITPFLDRWFGTAWEDAQQVQQRAARGQPLTALNEKTGPVASDNKGGNQWQVRGLTVRIADTPEEREALINLRTYLYREVGKYTLDVPMRDQFDEKAFLIGVYEAGEPIASARVLVIDPKDEYEHDRFITWDDKYPPREQCSEISRLCVIPRARSWRAYQAVFFGIVKVLVASRRRYFIGCCTESLVNSYNHMFTLNFPGEIFRHDDLGEKAHHMFVCDFHHVIAGASQRAVVWSSLWARLGLWGLASGQVFTRESRSKRIARAVLCAAGVAFGSVATWLIETLRARRRSRMQVGVGRSS